MNIYVQGNNVKGSREKKIKPQDNTWCVIEEENWKTQHKILFANLQAEMIH